jgi:excisionase family DNA binding protein
MAKKKGDEFEEKILDVDASMQGTIAFKDPVNLRINGSFEGKLDTRGSLTIGENARVKANITGDRIIIAGRVTGDIKASESVSVISPAIIEGNIITPSFSVTEGSTIDGQISMKNVRSSTDQPDVFLTLKDVAQYLEVETRVVEDWAKTRKIPARQDGNEWIFQKSAIDRWIQEQNARV